MLHLKKLQSFSRVSVTDFVARGSRKNTDTEECREVVLSVVYMHGKTIINLLIFDGRGGGGSWRSLSNIAPAYSRQSELPW